MTYEEMMNLQHSARRPSRDIEHGLQVACVNVFRRLYPSLAPVLFAVPNGGRRDKATGARLKDEGVVAGVSDLILLHRTERFGALCMELKTPTGRQSESQREWQKMAENHGNKYVVVRSVKDMTDAVADYLKT
jgi:hypothetical protein